MNLFELSPENYFGFKPGTEGKMLDYAPLVSYFRELEKHSDNIIVENLGKTDAGNDFVTVIVSSAENLKNLEKYAEISHKLASMKKYDEQLAENYANEGKAIVVNTMSIHSHEIGGGLASPQIVFDLLTGRCEKAEEILNNIIYVLFPSVNPDGQNIVYNFYKKYEGTELEGTQTYLANYHKFAAHANNRDFFAEHFMESSAVNDFTYRRFHASACIDIHHMQENNHRLVLSSPAADPVREELNPLLLRELSFYGCGVLCGAEKAGFIDAVSNYWEFNEETYWSIFATPKYHNIISLLCENANTRKGLYGEFVMPDMQTIAYKGNVPSVSNPHPWESSFWSLNDIVNQIYTCVNTYLQLIVTNRKEILKNIALKAARQTERGKATQEQGYFLQPDTRDYGSYNRFLKILKNHKIEILKLKEDFITDSNEKISKGTIYVPLAQPNFAIASVLLKKRIVPSNRYTRNPEGYDYANDGSYCIPGTASANLAEWMGINAIPANKHLDVEFEEVFDDKLNSNNKLPLNIADSNSYILANELLHYGKDVYLNNGVINTINGLKLKSKRIALLFTPSDESSFTNFTLHRHNFKYKYVSGLDIRNGALKNVDVLVFPGHSKAYLERDDYGSKTLAFENQHCMGKPTAEKIGEFVKNGGRVVTWNGSCNYFIEHFNLPIKDLVTGLERAKYQVHHSTLKVESLQNDILTTGILPEQTFVFGDSSAFEILDTKKCKPLIKIAERDILSSGLLVGEELIKGKVCALKAEYGEGDIVMCGFDPQYMSLATSQFNILLNALYDFS